MTSRQTLPQQAGRSRDSLVAALRAPGDSTELIAQRARRLLHWKPNGVDRDTWLGVVLPEAWHVTKSVAALNATSGNGNGATTSNGSVQSDTSGNGSQGQQRSRHTRRQRRT